MKRAIIAVAILVGIVALGGGFLLTWEIPPPTVQVEKAISNDRFTR